MWTEPKTWSMSESVYARDFNGVLNDVTVYNRALQSERSRFFSWIYEAISEWRRRSYRQPDRIVVTEALRRELLLSVDGYRAIQMSADQDKDDTLFGIPMQVSPWIRENVVCFALA